MQQNKKQQNRMFVPDFKVEFKVETEFQQITNKQGKKERITEMIIRKAIRKIKKQESRLGQNAEWINEGGGGGCDFLYIFYQDQNRKSNTSGN